MRLAAVKPPPFCLTARRAVRRAARSRRLLQVRYAAFHRTRKLSDIAKAAVLGIFANVAAFNLPCFFALSETPPSVWAVQTAHLRGAPHSALPNAAGGGEAAATLPDRPQGGQARRALVRILAIPVPILLSKICITHKKTPPEKQREFLLIEIKP